MLSFLVRKIKRGLEFRRRHAGDALKNAREVLWIIERKSVGDLGEIHIALADEALGTVYLGALGKVGNRVAGLLSEEL